MIDRNDRSTLPLLSPGGREPRGYSLATDSFGRHVVRAPESLGRRVVRTFESGTDGYLAAVEWREALSAAYLAGLQERRLEAS